MKRLLINSAIAITAIIFFCSNSILKAQLPSPANWLNQIGSEYDSTTQVYTIELEWQNGLIDEQHPQAKGYNVYRSMIGHNIDVDDYELVGTASDADAIDGTYKFKDDMIIPGGYFYYVRGIYNESLGELSPVIQAFSRTSYCVNMNAEIIDFKSYPKSIAIPGELYEYQAFAKHRSARVQGWVRYTLVEGPANMTIDNLSGILQWTPPENAEGSFYVKIRATSDEDSRAESIQEWFIRIANNNELISLPTSVNDIVYNHSLLLYPSPAKDEINLNYYSLGNQIQIELVSLDGELISNRSLNVNQGENLINLPVNNLSAGTYLLKIIDNKKVSTGKLIICD